MTLAHDICNNGDREMPLAKGVMMEKHLKNWAIVSIVIFYCTSPMMHAYQINVSFDSLFPMTWYQKGLESSMHVWQSLINVFEKSGDGAILSFDLLLGRLAFAQFCISRMHQQEETIRIADDTAYFAAVLNKVKRLLALVVITPKTHDFVLCAEDMIQEMEKKLSSGD